MVNLALNNDIGIVSSLLQWLSLFYTVVFGFYLVLVFLNFNFVYEYLFIETGLPGPFISRRYTFVYFTFVVTILRYLIPVTALWMLEDRRGLWRKDIHRTITRLVLILDIIIGIIYFWYKCTCNAAIFPHNPCNSLFYCCVNFTKHPDVCPNTSGCVPAVQEIELHANNTFVLACLFTLGFILLDFFQLVFNRLYRKYLRNALTFDDGGISEDAQTFFDNIGWNASCTTCKDGMVMPIGSGINIRRQTTNPSHGTVCTGCWKLNGGSRSSAEKIELYKGNGWSRPCDGCNTNMYPHNVGRLRRGKRYLGMFLRCPRCAAFYDDQHQRWTISEHDAYMS